MYAPIASKQSQLSPPLLPHSHTFYIYPPSWKGYVFRNAPCEMGQEESKMTTLLYMSKVSAA